MFVGRARKHYILIMNKLEKALTSNLKVFVAFARKRLGDEQMAEDVVQESLLKALKSAKAPEKDEEIVTWFYRILRRSIIEIYRRRETRGRMLEKFKDSMPDVPVPADEKSLCQCFRRLLPDIPQTYRELLERIDLGGETPSDVAESLGITRNALNVRLHRARKRLRVELEKTCQVCSKHGCLDCTCASGHQ